MMEPRIDFYKAAPEVVNAMRGLEQVVSNSGLEASLRELVKLRASQMNGCAYCIDMHAKDARAGRESEQRLYALNAWRETPFYSERELVSLTLAIVAINGWNRLAIAFRAVPGRYQAKAAESPYDTGPK